MRTLQKGWSQSTSGTWASLNCWCPHPDGCPRSNVVHLGSHLQSGRHGDGHTSSALSPPQRTVLAGTLGWESGEYCLLPGEDGDLAGLGQPLDYLGLVVGVVDPGLPEFSRVAVLLPVVVPVSTAVGPKAKDVDLEDSRAPSEPSCPRGEGVVEAETDLVAHVQGEEQHQHAGGGVTAMVSGPVVVHVFEEGRVEDLDLRRDTGESQPASEDQPQDPDPHHLTKTGLETNLVFVHAQELLHRCVRAGGDRTRLHSVRGAAAWDG